MRLFGKKVFFSGVVVVLRRHTMGGARRGRLTVEAQRRRAKRSLEPLGEGERTTEAQRHGGGKRKEIEDPLGSVPLYLRGYSTPLWCGYAIKPHVGSGRVRIHITPEAV